MQSPISAEKNLAITLKYLETEESLNSLKYRFRVHETAVGKFIVPVCEAIYNVLAPDYMKCPSTKEEWEYIIDQTNNRWQLLNCYAAVDRHTDIICRNNNASEFHNYKGCFSILIFVDYDKFLIADVGCLGRISDKVI